jgi:hypothetical protein
VFSRSHGNTFLRQPAAVSRFLLKLCGAALVTRSYVALTERRVYVLIIYIVYKEAAGHDTNEKSRIYGSLREMSVSGTCAIAMHPLERPMARESR